MTSFALLTEQMLGVPQNPLILGVSIILSVQEVGVAASSSLTLGEVADALFGLLLV